MKNYSVRVDRSEVLAWIGADKKEEKKEPSTADVCSHVHSGHRKAGDSANTLSPQSELWETQKEKEDSALLRQIERAVRTVESVAAARYTYAVFDIDSVSDTASVTLKGAALQLTGTDIVSLLDGCGRCILMAVTLGPQLDRAIRKEQLASMSDALLLDLCASSAADDLCNRIYLDLEEEFLTRGFFLTDRFSPGYGDLPVELQSEICRALQAEKRIGLSVTSGSMLLPVKSITAVIGISRRPQPKKISGCKNCKMKETCSFRKAGKICE